MRRVSGDNLVAFGYFPPPWDDFNNREDGGEERGRDDGV